MEPSFLRKHLLRCLWAHTQICKVKFLSRCLFPSSYSQPCNVTSGHFFELASIVLFLSLFIPNIYMPVGSGRVETCFGMNDHHLQLLASFHVDYLGKSWAAQPFGWFVRVSPKLGDTLDLPLASGSGALQTQLLRGSGC